MPSPLSAPIHLGLDGRAAAQPDFTGMAWYADYAARTADDGAEGRLVTMYRFMESWGSWDRHPAGDDVVVRLAGTMTLHQEMADGSTATVLLGPDDYAINPPGCWHAADIAGEPSALFITASMGTEHRPADRLTHTDCS